MVAKTKLIFRIVFCAWVAIWLLFLIRGLVKGEAEDYGTLFAGSLEEKRAYITGKEFYDFILFCKNIIPEDSDYTVEADYDHSMDYFRFAYYMYPVLRNLDNPEYVVCYKVKFSKKGYRPVALMSKNKYILMKVKGKN